MPCGADTRYSRGEFSSLCFLLAGTEVRDRRGGRITSGSKMDSMELERERGITNQSAAKSCDWNGKSPSTGKLESLLSISSTRLVRLALVFILLCGLMTLWLCLG